MSDIEKSYYESHYRLGYEVGYQQGRADERKRITDILKDELESGYLLEKLLRRITND